MAANTGNSRDGERPARIYRGSRHRLRRIKFRGNSSAELWLVLAWVIILLFVVLPWMIRQGR